MKKLLPIIIALILFLLPVSIVLAVDTSQATYTATIRITNNSTATTNVAVPFNADTDVYIDGGYMNSSANNTAVLSSSGADVRYMPAISGNTTWSVFVPSIGANTIKNDTLYMGGTTDMGGLIRYFPGAEGMTTVDSATLEPGANFTERISGGFDSTVSGNITTKPGAFILAGDGSGNITANVTGGTINDNFDADLWTDVGTKIHVNTGNSRLEYEAERSAIDERSYRALPAAVDDTVWILNFTFHPTSKAGAGGIFIFGLLDTPGNINGFAGDGISFTQQDDNLSIRWDNSGSAGNSGSFAIIQNTTYYVSLERASSILARLSVFTDAARTTHTAGSPVTVAIGADIVALDIIQGSNFNDNNGAANEVIGWIDDVSDILGFVSVSGVASGEREINFYKNPSLAGFEIDHNSGLPAGDGLTLNLPLHHNDMTGVTLTSKDDNARTATVTEAVWSNQGRVLDAVNDQITVTFADTIRAIEYWWSPTTTITTASAAKGISSVAFTNDVNIYTGAATGNIANETMTLRSAVPAVQTGIISQTWTGGIFYHIIWNWNGANYIPYVNGEAATVAHGGSGVGLITVERLNLGDSEDGAAKIVQTYGEARLYTVAMTPSRILLNYNNTKWRYDGTTALDSEDYFQYVASSSSVIDNSANWTSFTNSVMPYVEYMEITIGGVQRQYIEWENAAIFADGSGNSHDATPTFRTISSDADVSAVLVDFAPVSEAKAPAYAIDIPTTGWITENITTTGNYTSNVTASTYPGSAVITDIATAGETPVSVLTLILGCGIILAFSLFISWIMKANQERSLMIKLITVAAGVGIMIAIAAFDQWLLYMFLMIGIAIVMASSSRTFSGTGNTGNNMLGFLSMSFVGMTMINRILEGRFLQTTDIAIVREVVAFQPFNVFGLFTIPVPNVSFLTNGIPALMRWDYSFFGGNSQIIQYLLYSVTAVVSFMLFVLVFGAIYQMFSRGR